MRSSRIRSFALAATIALEPSPFRLVLVQDDHLYYRVSIGLADVAAVVLIALTAAPLIRAIAARRVGTIGLLLAAFVAVTALAVLVHPSAQGIQTLFRLVTGIAIALTIAGPGAPGDRRLLLFAVALTAVTQTLLAVLELSLFGFITPVGTFPHTFVLAGYALVAAAIFTTESLARGGRGWALLASVAIVPVGLSVSRAAALAVALMAAPLVPGVFRGSRAHRIGLAALLLGAGLPALFVLDGWLERSQRYPPSASAARRVELITQTAPILAANLPLGIGPGNTAAALRERKSDVPGSVDLIQPPHDVPYLVTLETGVAGGLLAIWLLAGIGLRAWRRGSAQTMSFLALVPYLLLDDYAWTAPPGLALLGLWAATALAEHTTGTDG